MSPHSQRCHNLLGRQNRGALVEKLAHAKAPRKKKKKAPEPEEASSRRDYAIVPKWINLVWVQFLRVPLLLLFLLLIIIILYLTFLSCHFLLVVTIIIIISILYIFSLKQLKVPRAEAEAEEEEAEEAGSQAKPNNTFPVRFEGPQEEEEAGGLGGPLRGPAELSHEPRLDDGEGPS